MGIPSAEVQTGSFTVDSGHGVVQGGNISDVFTLHAQSSEISSQFGSVEQVVMNVPDDIGV